LTTFQQSLPAGAAAVQDRTRIDSGEPEGMAGNPAGLDWRLSSGWRKQLGGLLALETPRVVLDTGVIQANIAAAQQIADSNAVALRPHVKTHKSRQIAAWQIAAGASGVTAAKPSEALAFIDAGVPSVTVAYPIVDERKIARLLEAGLSRAVDVRFVVDSEIGIAALAAQACRFNLTVPVYIEIDVGLNRCGVSPVGSKLAELARRLTSHESLRFKGLLSHAGQAYGASGAGQVREIAAMERSLLAGLCARLADLGMACEERSVGSTPTHYLNAGFAGLTESRPGNYVFMDLMQIALGVALPGDIALSVLATVVSVNDKFAIVDAGSKVLSSDGAPHGAGTLSGHGLAFELESAAPIPMPVSRLSEEHGFIDHRGRPPGVGSKVRIVPNHSCPVANLAETYSVAGESGGIDTWKVDARGAVA
jgi:D-serine deaminase-like pyridoxal phosphate-dependent protein